MQTTQWYIQQIRHDKTAYHKQTILIAHHYLVQTFCTAPHYSVSQSWRDHRLPSQLTECLHTASCNAKRRPSLACGRRRSAPPCELRPSPPQGQTPDAPYPSHLWWCSGACSCTRHNNSVTQQSTTVSSTDWSPGTLSTITRTRFKVKRSKALKVQS